MYSDEHKRRLKQVLPRFTLLIYFGVLPLQGSRTRNFSAALVEEGFGGSSAAAFTDVDVTVGAGRATVTFACPRERWRPETSWLGGCAVGRLS